MMRLNCSLKTYCHHLRMMILPLMRATLCRVIIYQSYNYFCHDMESNAQLVRCCSESSDLFSEETTGSNG